MESTRYVFDGAQAIFKIIRKMKNGLRRIKNCSTGLDNLKIVKTMKKTRAVGHEFWTFRKFMFITAPFLCLFILKLKSTPFLTHDIGPGAENGL